MKTQTNILIIVFLLSTVTFTSCKKHRIEGNNNVQSETRVMGSFDKVKASSSYTVNIHFDTVSRVVITAEENIIPYIKTDISSNTLELGIRNHFGVRPHYEIIVDVYTPSLTGITLSGSGSVNSDHFSSSTMDVTLSGSGDIKADASVDNMYADISGSGSCDIKGNCLNAVYKISGSGNIKALEMQSVKCNATISGSGEMYISVSDYLNVRISGSGDVYYMGNPSLETSISGSGKVIKY
jgi:hypothetical protein